MVTFFTIPKPFEGHIAVIQENAIASWRRLSKQVEIILCGDETGTEEIADKYGAIYCKDIKKNEYGTPYLNSAFNIVQQRAKYENICYVNSDIIFLYDFLSMIMSIRSKNYFVVGKRRNIEIKNIIDFENYLSKRGQKNWFIKHSIMQGPGSMDYFCFAKSQPLMDLPPFLVGRPAWDNWLLARAKSLGIKILDATNTITCIHQNHDYAHVAERRGNSWEGPEGDWNRNIVGVEKNVGSIYDADYKSYFFGILPALECRYVERKIKNRLEARRQKKR